MQHSSFDTIGKVARSMRWQQIILLLEDAASSISHTTVQPSAIAGRVSTSLYHSHARTPHAPPPPDVVTSNVTSRSPMGPSSRLTSSHTPTLQGRSSTTPAIPHVPSAADSTPGLRQTHHPPVRGASRESAVGTTGAAPRLDHSSTETSTTRVLSTESPKAGLREANSTISQTPGTAALSTPTTRAKPLNNSSSRERPARPSFKDITPHEGKDYLIAAAHQHVQPTAQACGIAVRFAIGQAPHMRAIQACKTVWAIRKLTNQGLLRLAHADVQLLLTAVDHASAEQLELTDPATLTTWNAIDLCQLLYGYASLAQRPSSRLVHCVLNRAVALLDSFGARETANMLYSLGKLEVQLPRASLEPLVQQAQKRIFRTIPIEVSNLVWGLARLKYDLPQDFVDDLVAATTPKLGHFVPQGYSNLMWGLASMQCKVPPAFVMAVIKSSHPKLDAFKVQELVNLMWALATMRYPVPEAFAGDVLEAVWPKMSEFKPVDLSMMLWALLALGSSVPQRLVDDFLLMAQQTLESFKPGDYSSFLWALVSSGCTVPPEFVSSFLEAALKQLPEFHPRDSSKLLWALVKGGHGVPPRLVEHILADSGKKLAGFAPLDVSQVLWSLATLNYNVPERFLEDLVTAVQPRLHKFEPQQLATLLWALGTLQHRLPQAFVGDYVRAVDPKLGAFCPLDLCQMMWGLAVLQCGLPQDFVMDVVRAACKQRALFKPQDVYFMEWSLEHFSARAAALFRRDCMQE